MHFIKDTMAKINNVSLNFNKVCRACLCENEEMINMCNNEQTEENILDMFTAVTNVEVSFCEPEYSCKQ